MALKKKKKVRKAAKKITKKSVKKTKKAVKRKPAAKKKVIAKKKPTAKKAAKNEGKLIGLVTHYFPHVQATAIPKYRYGTK